MKALAPLALAALVVAGSASADQARLPVDVTKLIVDPVTPSTIYALAGPGATATGVYKSTNSGVTWDLLLGSQLLGPPLDASDLAIDPQKNPSTVYVSDAIDQSIDKTSNGGTNWFGSGTGITVLNNGSQYNWIAAMAVDPVNEGVIYAASDNTGLYKSTDGGQHWARSDSGITGLTNEYLFTQQIIVDPANPSTIYYAAYSIAFGGVPVTTPSGLYKSTDGGATWNPTAILADVTSVVMDPEDHLHLVACADNLIQYSSDGGATWSSGGYGCGPGAFHGVAPIAIDPANSNHVLVGSFSGSGHPAIETSSDGGQTFTASGLTGLSVISLAFDPSNPNNVYAGTSGSGLYISRDGGITWAAYLMAPFRSGTIHVPADEPTIQAAIDAASTNNSVIVAPGTYYEQLDFKGKAITVKSSGGAAVTILDGQNSGPIVTFDNGEVGDSVLQGFTLTHALNDAAGSSGAVWISGTSPAIEDNVFVDNADVPGTFGGSALSAEPSSAVIIRNYFVNNTGYYAVSLVAFDPTVADNVFANNSGSALFVDTTVGTPRIYNNTIVGNATGVATPVLTSIINPTYAAFTPASISNNLIAFNQVGIDVFSDDTPPAYFTDNLVYGNTTANYQGITDPTGTQGNLSADPLLKDWANGDVHLLFGSPAIDVGDSTVIQASATDFYGNARVATGNPAGSEVVDIGAIEYAPPMVTAADGSLQVLLNITKTGTLGTSGADSTEPLTFALVTLPTHGTLTLTDAATGAFQYVPAHGYFGPDSFTFYITDPYGTLSNTATEQVTVANTAPTANAGSVMTGPGAPVGGTLSATSAYHGQKLIFSLVSKPAHGSVNLTSGSGQFTYAPATGFVGGDSFSFKVTDQLGDTSNVAIESVTVGDLPATASAATIRVLPNQSYKDFLKAVKAYSGQTLHYSVVGTPQHGSLTLTNPSTGAYTYTPVHAYKGRDSFSFQVVDQYSVVSNTATVSVVVL